MVVGVIFEVGLVFVVGLEVYLIALEDFQGLLQAMRDLLGHEIKALRSQVQLL